MEARKPPGSLSMNFYRGSLHLLSAFTVCALQSMSVRFSAVFSSIATGEGSRGNEIFWLQKLLDLGRPSKLVAEARQSSWDDGRHACHPITLPSLLSKEK
jgi:hypothetical protein